MLAWQCTRFRVRGMRRWPRQCAPHSLFVLDKKRMGRARSKRKKRCGGSVRASAYLRPPAEDGWPFLVEVPIKRDAPGESSSPGKSRIPLRSLSAGAALAVTDGWRGPTRASAPTVVIAGNPANGRTHRSAPSGTARHLPPRSYPVGADAHIRPFPAPIHHQTKRKRIQKGGPFDTHPEFSTRLAHAAQDSRK